MRRPSQRQVDAAATNLRACRPSGLTETSRRQSRKRSTASTGPRVGKPPVPHAPKANHGEPQNIEQGTPNVEVTAGRFGLRS